MSVHRSPNHRADGTFVVVDKTVVHNKALSFRARGLHAWMLDHPADWDFSSERIALETTEGRDAIRAAMTELKNAGLLRRVTASRGDKAMSTRVEVREAVTVEWGESPQVNTTTDSQATDSQASETQASKEGLSVSNVTEDPSIRRPTQAFGQPTWGDLVDEAFQRLEGKQLPYRVKVGFGRSFDRVANEQGIGVARSVFISACRSVQRGERTMHQAIREEVKDALDWYGHDDEQAYTDALGDRDVRRTTPGMTLAFLAEQELPWKDNDDATQAL